MKNALFPLWDLGCCTFKGAFEYANQTLNFTGKQKDQKAKIWPFIFIKFY